MPNVSHANLTGANLHEPKGASSATSGQVYASNGAGSGTWKKLNDVDNMDYSVKGKNLFGWNDIADSTYTSGSPRSITASTRTKLTNNGGASQTDTSRLGALWSTANNNFLINDLNAMYILRLNMKAKTSSVAGTPYLALIELESANGPTVIGGHTQFVKGGSAVNHISVSFPIYMGSFINNQTLSIYVTPDTNMDFYDIGFVLQRTYKES